MSNNFFTPQQSGKPNQARRKKNFFSPHLPGMITQLLGTGENAKDSLIYLTLKWSFYSGIAITFLVVLNNWCFRNEGKVPNLMEDISLTWEIILPIITLALGYAFGKSER